MSIGKPPSVECPGCGEMIPYEVDQNVGRSAAAHGEIVCFPEPYRLQDHTCDPKKVAGYRGSSVWQDMPWSIDP